MTCTAQGASRHQLLDQRVRIGLMRGNEVRLLPISLADPKEDEQMRGLFRRQSEEEYGEVIGKCRDFHVELRKERAAQHFTFAELEENEEELAKIAAWIAKIAKRDFFGTPARSKATQAMAAARRDLERYRLEVADAQGVRQQPRPTRPGSAPPRRRS